MKIPSLLLASILALGTAADLRAADAVSAPKTGEATPAPDAIARSSNALGDAIATLAKAPSTAKQEPQKGNARPGDANPKTDGKTEPAKAGADPVK